MRVRTESFVARQWPGRAFTPVDPQTIPPSESNLTHSYWVRFDDAGEPRVVGLTLGNVTDIDPVFVAVSVSSDGTARRSLWEYGVTFGWRHLGGDGTPNAA